MKTFLYRLIFIIIILSSFFGIYKQLAILLNAQTETQRLGAKISTLIQKNNELKQVLGN